MNELVKIFARLLVMLYGIFGLIISLLLFSINKMIEFIYWFFAESASRLYNSYNWLYEKIID